MDLDFNIPLHPLTLLNDREIIFVPGTWLSNIPLFLICITR
jgi:hypothetical protein